MNPGGYSGGPDNSFMRTPNPSMDLMRAFQSYIPEVPQVAPAASLGTPTSWTANPAGDSNWGIQGGALSDYASPEKSWMGSAFDWLKGFPGSDAGKAILGFRDDKGNQTMGLGSLAIGGISALGNLYMGMKQYDLMKDQLGFSKDSFAKNWEAQKTTTNSALEDRQKARVASNAGAYESVGSYMKKNGIKG
jgi:hypothetical protein